MDKVRVALIGAGWVTEHGYVPHLGATSSMQVVTVYDPVQERAQRIASRVGLARAASDFSECLESSAEAILICTPPDLHLSLVRRSLAAGKYVLCEKPVVRDLAEAEMLCAIKDVDSRLMGSATTRLRRDVELMLSWVHGRRLGRLERIRLGWWRGRGVPSHEPWRTDPTICPGGVVDDLGPHLLDIAATVLPSSPTLSEELVDCVLECRYGHLGRHASWFGNAQAVAYEVPDFARAVFSSSHCPVIELETCWASNEEGDISVLRFEGSEGVATLRGLFGFSTTRRIREQVCTLHVKGNLVETAHFTPGPLEQQNAFGRSIDIFARFCRGRARPVAGLNEVIRVSRYLTAIHRNTLAAVA